MNARLEIAQLLARFKLGAKRSLQMNVDLHRLQTDMAYASETIRIVEDKTDDETLLVLALQLHEVLLASPKTISAPAAPAPKVEEPATASRSYKFGARSW